ncbi:hypothetical protein BH09BAC5_BH09BAC5_07150 [soil metagenome]
MSVSFRNRLNADYVLTFFAEFLVLLAGVLVYKLAAKDLGEQGFSQYALCRRTISFIQPLLIIGLGVAIPRYIAMAMAERTYKKPGNYFIGGVLLMTIVALPILISMLIFSKQFSFLLFGDRSFEYLMPYLVIMLGGMLLHSICYGYFRGKVMMVHANIFQIINLGIVPLLVFYFFSTLTGVLLFTGIIWFSTGIITVLLFILPGLEWTKKELLESVKELWIYGIQRVPGDFALAGFLALPAYFAAHMIDDNLKTAGNVAFGMSMLNLGGAAFGPICLMLLPKASEVIVKKDFVLLKKLTNRITFWTIGLTVFGLIVAELFTEPIIKIYLGESFTELVFIVRIILLASIGYTLYISLRSILDAYYVKAINTKNIFISFVFFMIGAFAVYYSGSSFEYMLYGFIAAMLLLGALTFVETYRIFKLQKRD